MHIRRIAHVAAFSFLLGATQAQTCGPLNISTTVTGPGCAPFGGGIPTLTAGLGPSLPGSCNVPFTLQMPATIFAQRRQVLLVLGLTDPALPLAGFGLPTCTLRASNVAVVQMPAAGSNNLIYVFTLQVPQSPAFVGANVFAQGLVLPNATPGAMLAFSNGLAVSF